MDNLLDKLYFLNNKKADIIIPKLEDKSSKEPVVRLGDSSVSITEEGKQLIGQIIRVHNLEDYRRKNSSLLLIPKTSIIVDNLLFDRKKLMKQHIRLKGERSMTAE